MGFLLKGSLFCSFEIKLSVNIHGVIMFKVFSFIFIAVVIFSQNPKLNYTKSNTYRFLAAKYYKASKLDSSIIYFKKALEFRKNNPRLIENIAQLYALKNQPELSIQYYQKLLDLNVFAKIPEQLNKHPKQKNLDARFKKLQEKNGIYEHKVSIERGNNIHESITFDQKNKRYFISSLTEQTIFKYEKGKKTIFLTGTSPFMSLKINEGFLYASYSYLKELQQNNLKKSYGIKKININTGKVIRDFNFNLDEADHVFGDFIFDGQFVYISDSRQNTIYSLNLKTGIFKDFGLSKQLVSLQGIIKKNKNTFIIADYTDGLYSFDSEKKVLKKIQSDNHLVLVGIDGIYNYKNYILIVQNGIRPNRFSALKIRDKKIIESKILVQDQTYLNDPTLGHLIADKFYLLSNSGWPNLSRNGSITGHDSSKTHILEVDLSWLK